MSLTGCAVILVYSSKMKVCLTWICSSASQWVTYMHMVWLESLYISHMDGERKNSVMPYPSKLLSCAVYWVLGFFFRATKFLSTDLFKKALPKALSFLNGFLGSTTNAFPGTIPSTSPCITAIKESVVGSGPILIPGKSCSSRYLQAKKQGVSMRHELPKS